MTPPSDNAERLLAHAGWVRALARHLVRDPERAEDLVQDTWVAVLRRPPRASSIAGTRAFLGSVLRNALRHNARSERHREEREHASARPDVDPLGTGGLDLVDAVDSQRVLLEEVLKLDEPSRTTILLRYFRDLSAAEIARRENVPSATVRSRLKRALAELRERLDARHGGEREAWSVAFLAWSLPRLGPGGLATPGAIEAAAPGSPSPPLPDATLGSSVATPMATGAGVAAALPGVLLMNLTKIVALSGVAVLAVYGVTRVAGTPEVRPSAPEVHAELEPVTELAEPERTPSPDTTRAAIEREPARAAVEAPVHSRDTRDARAAVAEARPDTIVTARFVDTSGVALVGVALRVERDPNDRDGITPLAPRTATSGADGRARLTLPEVDSSGSLATDVSWSLEGFQLGGLRSVVELGERNDLGTLTLERGTPVSGFVHDTSGVPIEGARVWASAAALPDGDPGQIARRGPQSVTEGVNGREFPPAVLTDQDGSFRIPGVAVGDARVWAHATGRRYASSEPFSVPSEREVGGIEVELPALSPNDRIAGVVLSTDGEPVPRITVRYALHDDDFGMTSSFRADDEGRFEIVLWRAVPHSFTATGEDGASAHAARVLPGTLDLVLRLGEQDAYELVASTADGTPIESYRVTTYVGTAESSTGRVERGEEHPEGRMRIGKPAEAFWITVSAVGYALAEVGPFEPENVPAELEVVLTPAPCVRGRVLVDGVPTAGVPVELVRAVDTSQRVTINGFPALWQGTGEWARTNADGEYVLTPRSTGEFRVRAEYGAEHAPAESDVLQLSPSRGADDVDLELDAGGTLVVRVVAPAGTDVTGIVVGVTRADGRPRTLRTDTEGRAVFEHLVPGMWNVARTAEELEPNVTTSESGTAGPNDPLPAPPRDVEVHGGRTVTYTLVIDEE